jgi:DNA-binding response OmpR family regulator
LLVTSKSSESDKFWAQQQGADGYVVKPFTPAQLVGAVQKFVG